VASLAAPLAGKVVVDCVNPLGFDQQGAYALAVEEGSAAQQAQAVLPDSPGRLRNAHQVEALTANLISANLRYKAHAGLRVTDV
jgi:hypothetical protein